MKARTAKEVLADLAYEAQWCLPYHGAEIINKKREGEALYQALQELTTAVMEIIGEDETLEPEAEWYAKTKAHGGTHEEYWRLSAIMNNYNNLRAEQKLRATAWLGKDKYV